MAILRAGLLPSRQRPCGLPAVWAAKNTEYDDGVEGAPTGMDVPR
jgi:hypothetical protein